MMAARIPPSRPLEQRSPRSRNARHLAWIRRLPCLVCGATHSTEAAHVRYADASWNKRSSGISEKPDDRWTVPLCTDHHREQHAGNERTFWLSHRIDPLDVATALYTITGQTDLAIIFMQDMHNR